MSGEGIECQTCGSETTFEHDHNPDNTGLDDGISLLRPPRKKPTPKPAEEAARIRAAAWATRRQKWGPDGHR